jgi:hypothetical protein
MRSAGREAKKSGLTGQAGRSARAAVGEAYLVTPGHRHYRFDSGWNHPDHKCHG